MTTIYGEKYESTKDLRIAEVAKLIREDIKAAVKAGALPVGLKVSVRSESFSGGRAIRMSVTRLPWGFVLLNRARLAAEIENPLQDSREPRFSPEALALTEKLDAIAWAYNYDGSDTQSDYFHVRFYDGKAGFDYGLETAEIAAFKADTIIEKLEAEDTAALVAETALVVDAVESASSRAVLQEDRIAEPWNAGAPTPEAEPCYRHVFVNHACARCDAPDPARPPSGLAPGAPALTEVTRVLTEADVREAVRLAYEDAARILLEPRGGDPDAWRRQVGGIAERIMWRGLEFPSERGHGELPRERMARVGAAQ